MVVEHISTNCLSLMRKPIPNGETSPVQRIENGIGDAYKPIKNIIIYFSKKLQEFPENRLLSDQVAVITGYQ